MTELQVLSTKSINVNSFSSFKIGNNIPLWFLYMFLWENYIDDWISLLSLRCVINRPI